MKFESEFNIADRVQSAIAPEKHGIVTAIVFRERGVVQYQVCWADDLRDGYFHRFELAPCDAQKAAGF